MVFRTFARARSAIALAALLAACAPVTAGSPATAVPSVQPGATAPEAIHWFRNSAEMRGIYLEVYRTAAEQLDRLAAATAPQTWAVILDADETVLDNSTYQKRQDEIKARYSDSTWRLWVYQKAATALPGAVAFTRVVHQLGGRVVIVTNREIALCDATRENLRTVSIEADLVLCKTTTSDKNPRFESVTAGTASASLPPLKVLMWVGDNIQDFPKLTQALRAGDDSGYSQFGRMYFLLPNPMYGSWERLPFR